MTRNRKVEQELDRTMKAIRDGAAPWKFRKKDLDALRNHYRPGFEASQSIWPQVKQKILRLAKYQGALAALLAETTWRKPKNPTSPVPADCLWLASFLVQVACPPQLDPTKTALGPHCPKIDLSMAEGATTRSLGGLLTKLTTGKDLATTVGL